ncbi:MAG: TlyA family RNA methyltransferase [Pseudomonadota bacterium]
MGTERVDKVLVTRGLFESRASAQAAIEAGCVKVAGRVVTKASEKVPTDAEIDAEPAHPFVSRGGVKLAHALEVTACDSAECVAIDVGASTGGFSDALLQRGAKRVYAIDVGRGQLHPKLAEEARLISIEGMDARKLTAEHVSEPVDLIVCDASFISLEKLLEVPLSFGREGTRLIALFKPQFQVGRAAVGKGGIVRNASAIANAETAFCDWLTAQGWQVEARIDSPIHGGDGNTERFVCAIKVI